MKIIDCLRAVQTQRNANVFGFEEIQGSVVEQQPIGLQANIYASRFSNTLTNEPSKRTKCFRPSKEGLAAVKNHSHLGNLSLSNVLGQAIGERVLVCRAQ